jgi:hypothetical protein
MIQTIKQAKWQRLFSEQEESGESVAGFCRARGVREALFYYWKKRLREAAMPQFVEVQVAKPQLSLPALPDANFGSHRRRASTHLCAPSPAAYNSQKPANSRPTSTSIFAIQSVFPNPLSALYPQPSNNLNPIPIGPPRPSQTPATSFNRLYRKSRHWPRFAPDSSSAGPAIKYCSQQLTR